MTRKTETKGKKQAPQTREDRLKAALKANLRRRKDQSRDRATDQAGKEQQ